MFNGAMVELLGTALWETVYMVIISTILAYVLGLPIGIVLNVTSKDGVCPNKAINSVLGVIVNVFRSIPFLILLIWMLPFTMKIVGTMAVSYTHLTLPTILRV